MKKSTIMMAGTIAKYLTLAISKSILQAVTAGTTYKYLKENKYGDVPATAMAVVAAGGLGYVFDKVTDPILEKDIDDVADTLAKERAAAEEAKDTSKFAKVVKGDLQDIIDGSTIETSINAPIPDAKKTDDDEEDPEFPEEEGGAIAGEWPPRF